MDPIKFPKSSNCSLNITTWEELLDLHNKGSLKFTTGGLGPSIIHNIYLTWICVAGAIPWPARCSIVHYDVEMCALYDGSTAALLGPARCIIVHYDVICDGTFFMICNTDYSLSLMKECVHDVMVPHYLLCCMNAACKVH
jgi:hypothetical protein